MKTGFVAAEKLPQADASVRDAGTAPLYQIAIIAAAVLLVVSAAFL